MKQFNVVYVNETQYWNLPEAFKGAKISGVYVYCPNEKIYVCESTPSYELYFAHSTFDTSGCDFPDNKAESLNEFLITGDVDSDPVRYFHCHVIDSNKEEFRVKSIGEFETADDALEYAQGHCW